MIKFIRTDVDQLSTLSRNLTRDYNILSYLGKRPGAVKLVNFPSTNEIAAVYEVSDDTGLTSVDEELVEDRKVFLITTDITEANVFMEEYEKLGYVVSKPYIATMDEDFIVFVVAGKNPVEEDDDSDYPDSEEDL